MSALQFPSSEKVQQAQATTDTKTVKWAELAVDTVYAITCIKKVKGKYGASFVGDLETQAGDQSKVWLPQRLASDVSDRKLPVFVLNKGLRQSERNASRQYYDYKLIDN